MAYEVSLHSPPVGPAAADLSGYQYRFVKLTSTAVNICTAGTDYSIGILKNKPLSGQACAVESFGTEKCVAGAAVTRGDPIMPDAQGRGITATATNLVHGVALESVGAAGMLFTITLRTFGKI